jgi:succinate dehydrogenase (ubiquinone) membrane anchor subunit
MSGIVDADGSKVMNKFYHGSMVALAVLTPVSFALAPSPMNQPIDLALGVLYPVHGHVGLNYVISDYVPKAFRTAARVSLLGFTVATVAGLTQLNLQGPGMTQTVKNLWADKPRKTKDAAAAH